MNNMSRVLSATRYLIILPILGLLFAAGLFFVLGGIGLVWRRHRPPHRRSGTVRRTASLVAQTEQENHR